MDEPESVGIRTSRYMWRGDMLCASRYSSMSSTSTVFPSKQSYTSADWIMSGRLPMLCGCWAMIGSAMQRSCTPTPQNDTRHRSQRVVVGARSASRFSLCR